MILLTTVEKSNFVLLLKEIGNEFFPKELPVFNLYIHDHLNDLLLGVDITNREDISGSFEFGISISQLLHSVMLISSTFKTIILLRQNAKFTKRENSKEVVFYKWKEVLVNDGFNEKIAITISEKYHVRLLDFLNKKDEFQKI